MARWKKWNALIEDNFKKFCKTGDTGTEYAPYKRYECDAPYENSEHFWNNKNQTNQDLRFSNLN